MSAQLMDLARLHTTWSSRVDLPIPGSPPTSNAEPGTMPPPQTRSYSAMPLIRRGAFSDTPLRSTKSIRRPAPDARPRPFGALSGTASSTSVFHSPHASHLPPHLGKLAPQA